jgi:YesN/AraC family two-component response regulator
VVCGLNPLLGYGLSVEGVVVFENYGQMVEGIRAGRSRAPSPGSPAEDGCSLLVKEVLSAFENLEMKKVQSMVRTLPRTEGSLECMKRIAFSIAIKVKDYFEDRGVHIPQLEDDSLYRNIFSGNSMKSLEEYLDGILALYEKAVYDSSQSAIQKVCEYVKARMGGKITLAEAAGYVFLSPAYLSRIFKERMGVNFSDYVARVHMEEAMELLKDSRYKVYEVGEKLGYRDIRYFYKVFRQFTGLTPSQYRNRFIRGEPG